MPCSPRVMRTFSASHFLSSVSPVRFRSVSWDGTISESPLGIPAARKASVRFGLMTVRPRHSTKLRGLGSAATILRAKRAAFAICETSSVDKNCVGFRNIFSDGGNDLFNLGRRWSDKPFAIDANDLLMARNDAGLNDG